MRPKPDTNVLQSPFRRFRRLFAVVAVFSFFTNLLLLTGPLFMLQIYDRVLTSRSEETLVVLLGLVAALFALYGVLEYARGQIVARTGARFHLETGASLFRRILGHSRWGQDVVAPGIADLARLKAFFSSPLPLAFFDLPWTPVFILAIALFHPWLGLLALAGTLALLLAAIANHHLTARRLGHVPSTQATISAVSAAGDYVRAQGMVNAVADRWSLMERDQSRRELKYGAIAGISGAFSRSFRYFLQSAILALGAFLVLRSEITGGAMIAASLLTGRALAPVDQLVGGWSVVAEARSAWRSLRQTWDGATAPAAIMALPPPDGRLTVRNLTVLTRPGFPPILDGVSFDVQPGQILGVIGPSGAGKSTLARMIMGTGRPTAGEVRLSGALVQHHGAERLGRAVGYLPQVVDFFPGSIAENIAQMAQESDPERVIRAARAASVHEVILQLPDGYNTQLAPGRLPLSGGEAQRLALARALYHNPVLLVLDEPNSALDAEGTAALLTTLKRQRQRGLAAVVMTHRPTAIAACDTLVVLEGGRVSARGPRDEIIASNLRNAASVDRIVTSHLKGDVA